MHCSFCGTLFAKALEPYGKTLVCEATGCGKTTWFAPTPVAVAMVPVDEGLLLIERATPPMKGDLAFPGGYVERGETLEEAVSRELREETGLRISASRFSFFSNAHTANGKLLVFFLAESLRSTDLPEFVPNEEASGMRIATETMFLAFNVHRQMMEKYFRERKARV